MDLAARSGLTQEMLSNLGTGKHRPRLDTLTGMVRCSIGEPLEPTCQPEIDPACVVRICDVDPYCCYEWWHQGCVDAVQTVCDLCCCTKGIAPCD